MFLLHTMLRWRRWLFLAVLVGLALFLWEQDREIAQPDGRLAPGMPRQRALAEGDLRFVRLGDWRVVPLAHYEIEARVLGRKRYYWDAVSGLAPVDFALGWGPMSENEVLAPIEIAQRGRWYYSRSEGPMPSSIYSANTHMIPLDAAVRRVALSVRRGHVIRAEGYLVECFKPDREPWRSSLTRKDKGDGSCEIFLVRHLEIVSVAPRP